MGDTGLTVALVERAARFAYHLGDMLSKDLNQEDLWVRVPGDNPGIWVLGHLAADRCNVLAMCTGEDRTPAGWRELFGFGSTLRDDLSAYPDHQEIRKVLASEAERIFGYLAGLAADDLARPPARPHPLGLEFMPTIGDVVLKNAIHQASHAGQFYVLRTLAGKAPAI